MDWGMLIVTGIASVAAVVGAFVAVVQARSARRSEQDSIEARNEARAARDESSRLAAIATDAFVRQAEAQERANELKEQELTPAPWSVRWASGNLYQAVNTSGRAIMVERYEVEPDGTENRVRIRGNQDGLYQYGDAVDYMVSKVMARNARKLTLFWRFADEPEAELSAFIIPL